MEKYGREERREALWQAYCRGGYAELERVLKEDLGRRKGIHRELIGPDAGHTIEVMEVGGLDRWEKVRGDYLARAEERFRQEYAGIGKAEIDRVLEEWRQNARRVITFGDVIRLKMRDEGLGLEQVFEIISKGLREKRHVRVGRRMLGVCGGVGRVFLYPQSPEMLYTLGKTEDERFEIRRKILWDVYRRRGRGELLRRVARLGMGMHYGYPVGPAKGKFLYVRASRVLAERRPLSEEFDARLEAFIRDNKDMKNAELTFVLREARKYRTELLSIAEKGQKLLEEQLRQDKEHGWLEPVLEFLRSQTRKLIKWSLAEIEMDAAGRGQLNLRALLPVLLYKLRPRTIQVPVTQGFDKARLMRWFKHFQEVGGMGGKKVDQSGLFREAALGVLRQMKAYRIRFESWVELAREELKMCLIEDGVLYPGGEFAELLKVRRLPAERVKALTELYHYNRCEQDEWKEKSCIPMFGGDETNLPEDKKTIQVTLPNEDVAKEINDGVEFVRAIGAFEGDVVSFFREATWHVAQLMADHGIRMPALFELVEKELRRRLGEGAPRLRISEKEAIDSVLEKRQWDRVRNQKMREIQDWKERAIIPEEVVEAKRPSIKEVRLGLANREGGVILRADRSGG